MRKGNKYNGSNSSQVPLHTHRQKEEKKKQVNLIIVLHKEIIILTNINNGLR